MPRCQVCSNDFNRPDAILMVLDESSRWMAICRDCRQKQLAPGSLADIAPPTGQAPPPGAEESADSFLGVRRALEALRAHQARRTRQKASRDRMRQSERLPADITVQYNVARDDTFRAGQVVELSETGLKMVTPHRLSKGQILFFDAKKSSASALLPMFQGSAEIRWVDEMADGRFAVGARFGQRQVARGSNRRRHKRHQADMACLYRRAGSEITSYARVRDLSQGGMMLSASESLQKGEVIEFRVRGETGAFAKHDLVGASSVMRMLPRPGYYEIGCRFDKTRVDARPAPADK